MSELQPISLEKADDHQLVIRWSDGVEQKLRYRTIRNACPCATCMEKRMAVDEPVKGELKVLAPAETMPLEILSMRPVGNYAYNIQFNDGHSSGIFTYEILRRL